MSRYVPVDVYCRRCRQSPGQRCREVRRVFREWWGSDGSPLDEPRVVGLDLGREMRTPHPERVRFARSESERVDRSPARRSRRR